jgi:hypothetical protein
MVAVFELVALFQEHLENKHPEVARTDAFVSDRPFQFEIIFSRHGSIRASDIVDTSTSHDASSSIVENSDTLV